MAPARPLKELSRNATKTESFCDSILKKYQDYKQRDTQSWREWLEIGRMVANQRAGKLLLQQHPFDNRVVAMKRDSRFNDAKTVGGKFQFYSTKLTAEWLSSRPERDPICPSDDDQVEQFISAVKIVQDFYDTKFFTTAYETQESLSAQDYGTWITRYRFDPDLEEIVCELLDIPACKWDLRFKPEESSYFIYESKCATATLEHLFDFDFTEDGDDNDHWGLQLREQIAKQGGNVKGWGQQRPYGTSNDTPGETVVTEMWLQPSAYCEIDVERPEKTVSGTTIRGKLIELFPNGLCAVMANGHIIGLYAEQMKDHIVSGYYHLQSFSGQGKGISDAVDPYRQLCATHSQTSAYIEAHGTPSWMYNQDMVTEEMARNIGKPRKAIPVDFTNAPDGVRSVNDVIQAITPGNPGNSIWAHQEKQEANLQMAFQVTDFSNGIPGVDNKTATGAQIGDANAQMILVPQHLNKADHRKRSDVVIFNLFKKYVDKPKWFATKDINSITMGKYLSGKDFDNVTIDFQIVSNSEVPKTPYQQEVSWSRLLPLAGGLAGLSEAIMANPELTSEAMAAFGVKATVPTRKNIARVCRQRIEQAKQLLETEMEHQQIMVAVAQAVGSDELMPDNTELAKSIVSQLTPPINPWEPYHPIKIEWLSALLDNDEMMFASPELRDIITEMIQMHLKQQTLAQAYVAQDQNLAAIIAELPALVGEHIMNQQNQMLIQQQQAEQQMAQQQQQLQLEGQKAEISEKQSEAEHNRGKEMLDKQHSNALQLQAMQELGKLEAAKNKPRAKAA